MDESWRMQMGMSTSVKVRSSLPRRRSTEEIPSRHSGSETLDPEDFNDVFGGPPRSVLRRQFSGDAECFRPVVASSFYEEIFRIPETLIPMRRSGVGGNNRIRRLPEFRIPTSSRIERSDDGFYGDIFGMEDEIRRSRSRSLSKSNCSSVLSYEDLSPLRPVIPDDDNVSFSIFASKLRPINVPSRWNSTTGIPEEPLWQHGSPALSSNYYYYPSFYNHQTEQGLYIDSFRSLRNSIPQRVTSPEAIISLDPNSHVSFNVSIDDLELKSPSSVVSSSQFQDFDQPQTEQPLQEQELEQEDDDDDDDDDEVMSSYVIEINSDHREGTEEAIAIDEAIAWAKEKFQSASPNRNMNMEEHDKNQSRTETAKGLLDSQMIRCRSMSSPERELDALDNNIKEWSAGKESNIRQLLSTLHHILWENSGWQEISIANLMEISNVKKGYQKARLCLHPDKVQQRGSTLIQKYIAEKTFAILQEAWDVFVSQP